MSGTRVLRVTLQVSLIAVLTLFLFTEGGVRVEPLHVLAIPAYALSAICLFFLNDKSGPFAPVAISLTLALVLSGWGLFQAGLMPGIGPAHPVWASASDILGPLAGTPSIAPADTVLAIIPIILPFAIFMACFLAFDTDRAAMLLLASGLAVGVVGAIIAIVQLELFPDALMFGSKRYYLDSLTAFFVNRNTSATYLAMQMVIAAGFCFHYAADTELKDIWRTIIGQPRAASGRRLVSPALAASIVALIVIFTALMLTKSRAGIASGLCGLAVFCVLAAFYGPYSRKRRGMRKTGTGKTSSVRRLSTAALIVIALGIAGSLFAGRAIFRAEVRGLDDERFCLYPSMVRLLGDNWKFGVGFGTFETAFTPYRPPECELVSIIDRAHSFYLEAFITAGAIALPILLAVILTLLWSSIRGLRRRRAMRWAPMVGLGILTTVLLHSVVDFSLQIPGFAAWFAAATAGVVRISLTKKPASILTTAATTRRSG